MSIWYHLEHSERITSSKFETNQTYIYISGHLKKNLCLHTSKFSVSKKLNWSFFFKLTWKLQVETIFIFHVYIKWSVNKWKMMLRMWIKISELVLLVRANKQFLIDGLANPQFDLNQFRFLFTECSSDFSFNDIYLELIKLPTVYLII